MLATTLDTWRFVLQGPDHPQRLFPDFCSSGLTVAAGGAVMTLPRTACCVTFALHSLSYYPAPPIVGGMAADAASGATDKVKHLAHWSSCMQQPDWELPDCQTYSVQGWLASPRTSIIHGMGVDN